MTKQLVPTQIGKNIVHMKLSCACRLYHSDVWDPCFDITRRYRPVLHVTCNQCHLIRAFAFRCKTIRQWEMQALYNPDGIVN